MDNEGVIEEARKQGVDISDYSPEMVAKFASCVSERILAGESTRKAIIRCLVELRDLL